ncbi:MAG: DNA mismatch repair protein MutS [SAR202 cluster bacterium Io17-Chloro-G2]|nr:MAG: DNA mismatch repair protein MutS [SAR202 cluster bacterium Io17-Chloro-G2]
MTPIRRQYLKVKHSYPDAIVLFRLGDFYETFDDDARIAAQELEITLTSRSMGKDLRVPMAGVPAHSLENYLARLIKRGHKVAICEQLTEPSASKGLVDRGVVRVVTPGTVTEPALLAQNSNNYLAAVVEEGGSAGLAYADISTGEFAATQLDPRRLALELERIGAAEALTPAAEEPPLWASNGDGISGCMLTQVEPSAFDLESCTRDLLCLYGILSLESLGCQDLPLAVRAAGAILHYLGLTQKQSELPLANLAVYSTQSFMTLDVQTRRNLELFQAGRWGTGQLSLLSTLDQTRTPMGGRLLRRWLGQPLLEVEPLAQRLDAVEYFFQDAILRANTSALLRKIPDLERIRSRVQAGSVLPRDLVAMAHGLEAVDELSRLLAKDPSAAAPEVANGPGPQDQADRSAGAVEWLRRQLTPLPDVSALIRTAIVAEPSGAVGDGNVIQEGFAPELDQLKSGASDARRFIAGLEQRERDRTGIRGLKVGYNQVFGYYIEVSKVNSGQTPDDYIRRQTLTHAERYIVPELKEYESLVLNARERIEETERAIYRRVCAQVGESGGAITALAQAVAQADVFANLAEVAVNHGYVRPELNLGNTIAIQAGRHPVVELVLDPGAYVPNDVSLVTGECPVVVLTGPNMAGKSTFIRQVAIITLMAQIGSFVPASQATIGLTDRIFTRVGLQDDLATGQSTFMVEMVETAAILNQATSRSLVILDEVGRGTSTYDGLSIARSVIEHLHNDPRLGCKTLFATHYHELTGLAGILPGVRNFSVAVAEEDGDVVFLHRIVPGGADKSYGVHVAQLAGLPRGVVNRAWEVLEDLERDGHQITSPGKGKKTVAPAQQMQLFNPADTMADQLRRLDIPNLTPLEAINKLYQLQEQLRESEGCESRIALDQ